MSELRATLCAECGASVEAHAAQCPRCGAHRTPVAAPNAPPAGPAVDAAWREASRVTVHFLVGNALLRLPAALASSGASLWIATAFALAVGLAVLHRLKRRNVTVLAVWMYALAAGSALSLAASVLWWRWAHPPVWRAALAGAAVLLAAHTARALRASLRVVETP